MRFLRSLCFPSFMTVLALLVTTDLFAGPARCQGPVAFGSGTYEEFVVPGANETMANGINNHNEIVGVHRINSDGGHGFLLRRGAFVTYDYPNAVTTSFVDINDSGTIVGYYALPDGATGTFVYRRGIVSTVDNPGTDVWPVAINNAGSIVLRSLSGDRHFLLRQGSTEEIVPYPGAEESFVTDISASGELIGRARLPGEVRSFAFVWSGGEYSILYPCEPGLLPSMFVGSTPALAGFPVYPDLPAYGYVGFVERPSGVTLIEYPGDNFSQVLSVNSSRVAVGQVADLTPGIRSFIYWPR
jgi:hypothetical protein